MTENQRLYRKEIQRIKRAIKREEKRGYTFNDPLIFDQPKRITKQKLHELKRITPRKLRKQAIYLNTETGEITPASTHYENQRKLKRELKKRGIEPVDLPQFNSFTTLTEALEEIDRITLSNINEVEKALSNMTRERYPKIPIEERKRGLLSILEDNRTYAEMVGKGKDYDEYLSNHIGDIASLLTTIQYDSDASDVDIAFTSVATILNWGEKSESIEETMGYFNEYTI